MSKWMNQLTRSVAGIAVISLGSAGHAQQAPPANVKSVTMVAPIFHQLLAFQSPSRFLNIHEQKGSGQYLREAVSTNETPEAWTQMITVSGLSGAAGIPNLTAQRVAERLAGGFQKSCPDSFGVKDLSTLVVSGRPAHLELVGCGHVGDAGGKACASHSETALILVILGAEDVYTIQWAERRAPQQKASLDEALWSERLSQLKPIRLCAIVPGERAPYPSCVK